MGKLLDFFAGDQKRETDTEANQTEHESCRKPYGEIHCLSSMTNAARMAPGAYPQVHMASKGKSETKQKSE
jgi:hypothetical protein